MQGRLPIVAGNWKMYKSPQEAVQFVKDLLPKLEALEKVERVVCPPYLAIPAVAELLRGTAVKVGAQNVHWEIQGAFTSSISAPMLVGLVEYVIIGHSEVREYMCDTDENVNKRIKAALEHGLKPIIAVGEDAGQNERGETIAVIERQVNAAFQDIPASKLDAIVVAYEPIWAIKTRVALEPPAANKIIRDTVRSALAALYGGEAAEHVRIQYGGSVNTSNMHDFMSQPEIDGALVGGASLKVDDFVALCRIASEAKAAQI